MLRINRFLLQFTDFLRYPRIFFSQFGFFDFARRAARDFGENDFAGSFVPGQFFTELCYFIFGQSLIGFFLDDGGHYFTQALVGHADDTDILHFGMTHNMTFDLHRKNIFSAGNNDIFGPIDQPDKAVFVHAGNITGVQPSIP